MSKFAQWLKKNKSNFLSTDKAKKTMKRPEKLSPMLLMIIIHCSCSVNTTPSDKAYILLSRSFLRTSQGEAMYIPGFLVRLVCVIQKRMRVVATGLNQNSMIQRQSWLFFCRILNIDMAWKLFVLGFIRYVESVVIYCEIRICGQHVPCLFYTESISNLSLFLCTQRKGISSIAQHQLKE